MLMIKLSPRVEPRRRQVHRVPTEFTGIDLQQAGLLLASLRQVHPSRHLQVLHQTHRQRRLDPFRLRIGHAVDSRHDRRFGRLDDHIDTVGVTREREVQQVLQQLVRLGVWIITTGYRQTRLVLLHENDGRVLLSRRFILVADRILNELQRHFPLGGRRHFIISVIDITERHTRQDHQRKR